MKFATTSAWQIQFTVDRLYSNNKTYRANERAVVLTEHLQRAAEMLREAHPSAILTSINKISASETFILDDSITGEVQVVP